jgi:cyclase
MLLPRIIPCLLLNKGSLVKTINFKDPKYIGDPLNAVKIFNEKQVDEIIVLDISASEYNTEPDYKLIKNLAKECRMPLCYGGGIQTAEQAQKIFNLGVEKIALGTALQNNTEIVSEIITKVGSQSVVGVIDVKQNSKKEFVVFISNGKISCNADPVSYALKLQSLGVGEILLNNIDNDGLMKGFNLELINKVRERITIPLTVMGGAGNLDHVGEIIKEHGIIGVGAGSLFVFKGKFRAVLINYPTSSEKSDLFKKYFNENQKNINDN